MLLASRTTKTIGIKSSIFTDSMFLVLYLFSYSLAVLYDASFLALILPRKILLYVNMRVYM